MSPTRYILRSLAHHRFAYLGVLAGGVLGATVLLGALLAGDSVKASLRRIAAYRIGSATHAVLGGDRFFRQALADDFARATGARVAPVLYSRGVVSHAAPQHGVNRVQLVGVTDAFWQLGPTPARNPAIRFDAPPSDRATVVVINDTLARRLQVAQGDELIVRLQKPGILAGNAPVAGAESSLQSLRCRVAEIIDDAGFGRFSLETTQVPSPSVFLPLSALQTTLEQPARANVLLVEAADANKTAPPAARTSGDTPHEPAESLSRALAASAQLADYGLALKWLEAARTFELTSNRVFLDPEVADLIAAAVAGAQPVVSYLVNELRAGDRATPYSIATATTPAAAPFLPADLGPREIVLNDWLAADLQARPGGEVRLTFFQTGPAGALVEREATFRVRSIVPLTGLAADRAWMPEFPGITDVQNQSDWNPGLPLKLDRIRDKDERYWDEHRGAPKAFLSLAGGREIWSTRWGNTTAIRVPFTRERAAELTRLVLAALRPEMNQLQVRNLRSTADASAQSPVDFAGLFIGMSFFLILAALGLVAMLFQLTLLQRNREDALLGAVGVSPRKLLRWRLGEGAILLLLGGIGGLALAVAYTRAILHFLESIWASEASAATFAFAAEPASVAAGLAIFLVLSLAAIWLAIRRQTRAALSIRLAAHREETAPPARVRRSSAVIAAVSAVVALGAVGAANRALPAQAAFYLAGFALLAAGLGVCRWRLAAPPGRSSAGFTAKQLGRLNLRTRRTRSLTVVGLIATAVFMVLSVASFRKQVGDDWLERRSGTGGFTFWIETTAPLNYARDGAAGGFEEFASRKSQLGDVVPLRAGAGDNANCFNLNSTGQPQLLAVDSAQLTTRRAFPVKAADGWNSLAKLTASGALPALVDATTLQWALKRKVGDTLAYVDENGRPFRVEIVGTLTDSLFQGYVLVDEQLFLARFPSHAGYSVFLADARDPAAEQIAALRKHLENATRDAGGRVELTRDVLAAFHEIENTYIAIFNVLGSLGVVLGSLGLAIVVARNLRERRGEFAVMTAIGLPRRVLAGMVVAEFGRLILWGIGIGAAASIVAVWPSLPSLPTAPALALVAALLAGIVALNLAGGWLVFRWSVRNLRPGSSLAEI